MIGRRKFLGMAGSVLSLPLAPGMLEGAMLRKDLPAGGKELSEGSKEIPDRDKELWQSNEDRMQKNGLIESPAFVYPAMDPYRIPFSYRGSYHVISKKADTENSRLVIDTVRRSAITYKWQQSWANNLLELMLYKDGKEMGFTTSATPWALELQGDDAGATIVFADRDSVVIHTRNCALRMNAIREFSWVYGLGEGKYKIYDNQPGHYYYLQTYDGRPVQMGADADSAAAYILLEEKGEHTVLLRMITEEKDFHPLLPGHEQLIAKRKAEVDEWMKGAPAALPEHEAAAKTGWYLFWNLQVAPWGNYSRQSVLSSKKSMSMLWSWDICFNALALVRTQPALAWDQLFAVLDKQRENGLLPDVVSDLRCDFGFNKPPVWGWTILKMLEHTPASQQEAYIREAYPKVAKFHRWWYENRNLGGRGICAYMHGNDSGWDNSTIFDEKMPVESPDLTAFLILQAEGLAVMAERLGHGKDAVEYRAMAKSQLRLFKKTFITHEGFIYRVLTPEGPQVRKSTSLLTRVALLLGERLSVEERAVVVGELKQEGVFLTANGVASEAVNSVKYESNGYWRGPVWSPSTYLIFEGLLACGEKELAVKIATRFCDMVSLKSTFNENYDALTGKGQYDSGLTWTSSDFLLMTRWLAENKKN